MASSISHLLIIRSSAWWCASLWVLIQLLAKTRPVVVAVTMNIAVSVTMVCCAAQMLIAIGTQDKRLERENHAGHK
jgi:hypothetical protein